MEDKSVNVLFNTNLVSIQENSILINFGEDGDTKQYDNDLVYIFAGGELPTSFLEKAGVEISKRFGYIIKKHA